MVFEHVCAEANNVVAKGGLRFEVRCGARVICLQLDQSNLGSWPSDGRDEVCGAWGIVGDRPKKSGERRCMIRITLHYAGVFFFCCVEGSQSVYLEYD